MSTLDARRTVALALAVVLALGTVAAPVAADDGSEEGSGFTVNVSGEAGSGGGSGLMDCDGSPTDHECDKGGQLATPFIVVDYDGYNYGNFPDRTGGGGDEVTVSSGDQGQTVGFDCDLGPTPQESVCTGDLEDGGGDGDGE